MNAHRHRLTLDSRKRITLSRLIADEEHISSFIAYREGERIVLEPMIEIPAGEAWIYEDPKLLAEVKKGLSEDATFDLGSFAQHVDDDV